MTDAPPPRRDLVTAVVRLPFAALAALVELPLSRRGLALAFVAAAAAFTAAAWLRPPLSADVSSLAIPWAVRPADPPLQVVLGDWRVTVPDNIGASILGLCAVGALLVLCCPRWVGGVAGALLAAALAANAAAAVNHPLWVEAMDFEFEQRQQIVTVLAASKEPEMTALSNDRVGRPGQPSGDQQRADLLRGWPYLRYGRYLVCWAAVGLLLGTAGTLRRRTAHLAGWALAGVALAVAVCLPRLEAEYHWLRAVHLEAAGDTAAARAAIDEAVRACPDLARLERTALLAGKLDHRDGRPTTHEGLFRAYQLARVKDRPRPVSLMEDLPWQISGAVDPAGALETPLWGIDVLDLPDIAVAEAYADNPALAGSSKQAYSLFRGKERREALATLHALLARAGADDRAVRTQAERLWANTGLMYYLQEPALLDGAQATYHDHDRRLLAAQDAWRRAAQVGPRQPDVAIYLAAVRARVDRGRPERAEAEVAPLLAGLADRPLRADILVTLGDAYFEAGRMREARRRYAEAFDRYSLPTLINYRAQKQLGGL